MRALTYFLALLIVVSCTQETKEKKESEDMSNETNSGLKYEVITQGSGQKIQLGDEIFTHVVLTLEDGKEVWSTRVPGGSEFSFVLGETGLIAGFEEGVLRANDGDRIRLTIPPYLGYGEQGAPPDIPPNATLIFDIEILRVVSR